MDQAFRTFGHYDRAFATVAHYRPPHVRIRITNEECPFPGYVTEGRDDVVFWFVTFEDFVDEYARSGADTRAALAASRGPRAPRPTVVDLSRPPKWAADMAWAAAHPRR